MRAILIQLEEQTLFLFIICFCMTACNPGQPDKNDKFTDSSVNTRVIAYDTNFIMEAERFADLQLLRYQVPGFETLSLHQKELAYYLYEAALCGRDIVYDQKSKYGLLLRRTLDHMYSNYTGEKTSADWLKFEEYCGRVWFSNGNYHHYGNEKFIPGCSPEYFEQVAKNCDSIGFPNEPGESFIVFMARIKPVVFDPILEPKLVDRRPGIDNINASSVNFYEGVTQKEAASFYTRFNTSGNSPSWGLNSKLVKENGQLFEKTWKVGGMYTAALEKMVGWLEKATTVAENAQQKKTLQLLSEYYKTGDLKLFDEYNIAWVKDTSSLLDVVNGFIEVNLDPLGKKGGFESVVSMKDLVATRRIKAIGDQAQWFEDNSPLMPGHKKKNVKGIIAKAITVIAVSGMAAPATPVGINLPNPDWIRRVHGSKSVSLSNIIYSHNVASAKAGILDEFALNDTIKQRMKKHGYLAADLHTDMHECIGHASGQINPGVETPDKTLKIYSTCLEEARADLVALYYVMDPKLVQIGVMPSIEVGKAGYDNFMMNGMMTQLARLSMGQQVEESHLRNRQLIARWVYDKGKIENVVGFVKKNGKTYLQINDYNKLRSLFGQLLREIQRIKSEGDYAAGMNLVESYGIQVDPLLHKEILHRYELLNIKPYRGFVQPKLIPVMDGDRIIDVKIEYPTSFFKQMIEYGKNYSYLPVKN